MMNFYYDPVLGLRYDSLGELFIIDLDCIPQDIKFDTEYWIKYIKQTSVQIVKPFSESCVQIVGQITQYKL